MVRVPFRSETPSSSSLEVVDTEEHGSRAQSSSDQRQGTQRVGYGRSAAAAPAKARAFVINIDSHPSWGFLAGACKQTD